MIDTNEGLDCLLIIINVTLCTIRSIDRTRSRRTQHELYYAPGRCLTIPLPTYAFNKLLPTMGPMPSTNLTGTGAASAHNDKLSFVSMLHYIYCQGFFLKALTSGL